MTELQLDPAVAKLIEYAKGKKSLSYDELSDFLPEHIVNSEKIEEVLALLEENNIQLIEEENLSEEEEVEERKAPETEKNGLFITIKNPPSMIQYGYTSVKLARNTFSLRNRR